MRHSFWLITLLVHLATFAFAGPKEDAAKKRAEAEKLSTQGDYAAALTAYDDAEALFHDPNNDLGRAQVLMKLRRFAEANAAYQKYVDTGKAGKKKKEIEQAIESLSVILQTSISCASTPEGATVYLNSTVDAPLGVTPFTQNLPPGTHRFIFQKEGFDTLSQVVTIEAKTSQTIQVAMPDKPGLVSITATPAAAEISINGELKGQTPLDLKLPDGDYTIEASATGYATQRKKFEVKAKQSYSWSVDLTQPPAGKLSLSLSPNNATATINGEAISNTQTIDLTPGAYQVTISAPSYKTITQSVTIESEQESKLSVELEPEGIVLKVKTNRPSFVLAVNGAPLSLDEAGMAILPAGEQRIAFEAEGDSRWEQPVVLSAPTSAVVEFSRAPSLATKLFFGGSAVGAATSGVFFYAGLIRAIGIRRGCADEDFCQENLEAFTELDRERGVFLRVSLTTAIATGALLGYSLFRRHSEGETRVTFSSGQKQ
jgi:hypothetical protein